MLLFPLILAAAPLPAAVASGAAAPAASDKCQSTAPYYAYRDGKPLKPHKLTELPPATAYMAVFRHIGTCEVPMTMTEYRTHGRRR
jgi:hypothetical protein